MTRFILFILFGYSVILNAGNDPALLSAQQEFKKTNAAYLKYKGISMDTYYMVYTDHQSKSVIEGKNGKFVKFNAHVYTKIDDVEVYAIDDKLISINAGNKQISVGDNTQTELSPLQTNVDSLLSLCESVKVERVGASEKKYTLYFDDSYGSEFTQVDIHIDTKNSLYTKIVLYYSAKMNLQQDFYAEEKRPRLEIIYKNFKVLEAEPVMFDQSLYVSSTGGKLKPAQKYYNFRITDLRNQTRIKTQKKK